MLVNTVTYKNGRDISGQRFGKLVVVEPLGVTSHNYIVWRCICDCGNKIEVRSSCLKSGQTRSCGCLHRESALERQPRFSFGEASFRRLFSHYMSNANKRRIDFSLTDSDFRSIINQSCYYCGKEPSQTVKSYPTGKDFLVYNGVDRVDNSIGYTLENCVPCCKMCNWTKRDMSKKEFIAWIEKAYTHLKKMERL